MSAVEELPEVVARYLEALRTADWSACSDLLTNGAEVAGCSAGATRLAHYTETPTRVVRAGDAVTVEVEVEGATMYGSTVRFSAVRLFDLDGDRIRKASGWEGALAPLEEEAGIRTLIADYFAAANAKDWHALERVWTEDAVLVATGGPPRYGPAEIVRAYQRFLEPWKHHHDEVTRLLVCGSTATAEVHFQGETHDGRQSEIDVVDVIDVRDGQIARLSFWVDIAAWRKMLGG